MYMREDKVQCGRARLACRTHDVMKICLCKYLVLELKVNAPREHINKRVETVEMYKRLAVVIHAEHHL